MTGKRTKNNNKSHTTVSSSFMIVLVLLLFAFIVSAMYYLGVVFYTNRFPYNTTINGVDISNMTAENAKNAISRSLKNYTLTIHEKNDVDECIFANQLDMSYDDDGDVQNILQAYSPWLWAVNYFRHDNLTVSANFTYNSDALYTAVYSLKCFDYSESTVSENAYLTFENDKFVIHDAVEGTELDYDKAYNAIKNAIDNGVSEIDLSTENCYIKPEILSNDTNLLNALETVNKWISAVITYDFEDNRIETVNAEVIASFITCNENNEYIIDDSKVLNWVTTNLAYKYDTFGLTHEFTTHSGKTITLTGGDYGWCIARQATTSDLIDAIKQGESTSLTPQYQYTAKNRGVDDIGGTYVEVSIDEQKMWCYENYELKVETDVVTGDVTKGNGTPSGGVWAIDCHKSPATLGTLDTMGYSSYVNFWMSFNGNVGIHDSSWRSTYGGEIYKGNGSHGCVNTPYDAVKEIYEICNVGTAVVVY